MWNEAFLRTLEASKIPQTIANLEESCYKHVGIIFPEKVQGGIKASYHERMQNAKVVLNKWHTAMPCCVRQILQLRMVFPPIPLPRIPEPRAHRIDRMDSMIKAKSGLSALQQKLIPRTNTVRKVRAPYEDKVMGMY